MTGRRVFFWILAGGFQIVSGYATYFGLLETLVSSPITAGVFAAVINGGLLVCAHRSTEKSITETKRPLPDAASTEPGVADDGFVDKRALAFVAAAGLFGLSITLSTVGMFSVLGFQTGSTADSNAELSQILQRTKSLFYKVKDLASKKLDGEETNLSKRLDIAKRRAAAKSVAKRNAADVEVSQTNLKITDLNKKAEELRGFEPTHADGSTQLERIVALQAQIARLTSEYRIDRDAALLDEEKLLLSYTSPATRTLYDQAWSDLQRGKPLALMCAAFGVAPDLFAIIMMRLGERRRRLWGVVRATKIWTAKLWIELTTPPDLPAEPAIDIQVNDVFDRPLLQTAIPLDISAVSEESIREYFPLITDRLFDFFEERFEIPGLPADWKDKLDQGDTLILTAVEV